MQSDSPSPAELAPNTLVGSYRIVKEIGRGGMGSVYEAVHSVLPRRAAVKVMHSELRRHPGMATRMVQEAAILEDIRHPGIVRVYECNLLPDHRPWIAMQLMDGDTLANRLARVTVLTAAELCALLAQVADVLASVHARGIVHRDLKPDNLILTPHDSEYPLRLIDWGVARLGSVGRLTLDGLTPGTPIYMSPEQATGKNIGGPCDIYSLGVIAYEALVGAPPFDGRTLAEVVCLHLAGEPAPLRERTRAPAQLCDLIHRMLQKDPSTRPGALEVRAVARAVAHSLTLAPEYHEYELGTYDAAPVTIADLADLPAPVWSDETHVIDPDALELGVTQLELTPVVRKPRWTPEIGFAPPNAVDRGARAHVHGDREGAVAGPHGEVAAYGLLNPKSFRR
jgi:serine/threonine protein kinase